MSIPEKKKRISKKNKSAWRKTDIQDVEDFLEDQRQEERIGTFADKPDDELFIVDATPTKPKQTLLSEKQKRKLNALTKPLRSHAALENTSKVQDPIAKRNIVRQKKSGRVIEEEVRNPTKPRHFQANKDRAKYYEKLDALDGAKKQKQHAATDLWQEEDFRDKLPGLKDEKGWVSRELSLHIAGNMRLKQVKAHESLRHKTTKAKKFEAPHPGMSYNPSFEDHQALVANVVANEEGIIKKEKHLKRVTTKMFSKVTPEERDARKLMEMTAEATDDEAGEADGETGAAETTEENGTKQKSGKRQAAAAAVEDDTAYSTINAPVENKKKSKQQRRKELKQKELQQRQEAKKALKKQVADLNRIKSIKAEVLAEAEELNLLKKHRKSVAEKKKYQPKRLGQHKFVEPDLDVNMPEDIAGNLRNIKTESNLITDRFKNFQKRNILPTTVAVTRKKSKVKRFQRNSHKDPGVSYQMLREQRRAAAKQAALVSKDTIKV